MTTVLHFLGGVIFLYLAVNTVYFFIVAIAGRLRKSPRYHSSPLKKKIAILIPTYNEDSVIVNTVKKALEHQYDHFSVFVAAHRLRSDTVDALRSLPAHVMVVNFEIGSKARSLNALLNHIPDNDYDVALILDGDNVMMPGCLEKINDAFQQGFKAVQCHRIAKNKNTPVAVLDAISEEMNNHLFRRGQRALGFSANVIGSGMAFDFKKLKEIYNKPGILGNPACDREVDFEIMRWNTPVEFIDDAYVLDEKVASSSAFERQRTRWLESQVIHLRMFFSMEAKGVARNGNFYNKLFNNLMPPRVIMLLAYVFVVIAVAIDWLTPASLLWPSPGWWIAITVMYACCLFVSIPGYLYSRDTLRAVLYIPVLMVSMVRALLKMKVSRKEFLHTTKAFVD